ncbi:hypothetical protein CI610_03055 [invertebrate metagenome]|uniref:Uncharacterized protein n=1 Tax=invertebrate metagenome TaxID=1711999 RepID=A0A2H9T479_9ZZZZ
MPVCCQSSHIEIEIITALDFNIRFTKKRPSDYISITHVYMSISVNILTEHDVISGAIIRCNLKTTYIQQVYDMQTKSR